MVWPMLLGILGLLGIIVSVIILIASSITNAPYLPSDAESVALMVSFAEIRPGEKTVDVGSGDGRIVIAMAKAGAEAHGYEINPLLVWWSRMKIRKAGVSKTAFIHFKSFWPVDLGVFNVVTIFTLPYFMPRLEKKLKKELKDGSRVVGNGVILPGWRYARKDAPHGIFLYKIPVENK